MTIERYTIVRKDGEIFSRNIPHGGSRIGKWLSRAPKTVVDGAGERWAIIEKGKYHIAGPWNTFRYRLKRGLWLAEHMGRQKLWIEGNPTPFYLGAGHKHELDIEDTARAMYRQADSDIPDRVLRPPKTPWVTILLVAGFMLMLGVTIGRQFL